jgi:hypothetical protein
MQTIVGALGFLLLGFLLLFVANWNSTLVPAWMTLVNIALVALVLVGAGGVLLNANPAQADQFYRFCSSGLFFIALGMVFLFIANWNMGRAHAGMTFVLVVLGVAVLLYGTGTQATADLKTDANAAKYNVAIAGGAGVLAFCVAYGIIQYSPEMRKAFQTEKKFVRLLIRSEGAEAIPAYAPIFQLDGNEIPAARRGDFVEVMVPYTSSELIRSTPEKARPKTGGDPKATSMPPPPGVCGGAENIQALARLQQEDALTKTIYAQFYLVKPKPGLDPEPKPITFSVKLDQVLFDRNDGGVDYPAYPVHMCIDLRSKEDANALAQKAGTAPHPVPKGRELKEEPPAVVIGPQ